MSKEYANGGSGIFRPTKVLRDAKALHAELHDAVMRAFDRYRKRIVPAYLGAPSARARAVFHDFMWEELERGLAGNASVRLTRFRGRRLIVLEHGLLQLKKLNRKGMPWNYPTRNAVMFDMQVPISGLEPGVRVTLGVAINALGDEIESLDLIVMDGTGVAVREPLLDSRTLPLPMQLPMPVQRPRRTFKPRMKPGDDTRAGGSDASGNGDS